MSNYFTASANQRKGGVPSGTQTDSDDLAFRVDRLLRMTKDSIEDVKGGYLNASSPVRNNFRSPSFTKHTTEPPPPPPQARTWSESRRKLDKTDFIDEQTDYNDPVQSPPFSVYSELENQQKYSHTTRSPEDDEHSRRTRSNPSREEWNQSRFSSADRSPGYEERSRSATARSPGYEERSRRTTPQNPTEEGWAEASYQYSTQQPQRPRSPLSRRPTGNMARGGGKEPINDDVSRMLQLQEKHIKSLEKENDELRGLVVHLLQLKTQEMHDHAQQPKWKSTSETKKTDPAFHHTKSPRETASSFESEHYRSRTLSPGSQFVAELSQVLELEPGHHALLSDIVDKHSDIGLSPRNDDLRHRWK